MMDGYRRIERATRIVVLDGDDDDDDDVYTPSDTENTSDSDAPLIKRYIARKRGLQLTPRTPPSRVKTEMADTTEKEKENEKGKEKDQENGKELHKSTEELVNSNSNSSSDNPFQHVIRVIVGQEGKEYRLHTSLLREKSEWFKKCLVYELSGSEQTITLANVDPGSFHRFVEWIYRGTPSIDLEGRGTGTRDKGTDNDKDNAKMMYGDLDGLFAISKRLNAPTLQRDIGNSLIDLWHRSTMSVDEITSCIYAGTRKESLVRELWVSLIVFRKSDVQCTNVDFLLDLVNKQRSLLQCTLSSQELEHSYTDKPKEKPVEEKVPELPPAMVQKSNKNKGGERTTLKRARPSGNKQQIQDGGLPEPPPTKVQTIGDKTERIPVQQPGSNVGFQADSLPPDPALPKASIPNGVKAQTGVKRRKLDDKQQPGSKGNEDYRGLLNLFLKRIPEQDQAPC